MEPLRNGDLITVRKVEDDGSVRFTIYSAKPPNMDLKDGATVLASVRRGKGESPPVIHIFHDKHWDHKCCWISTCFVVSLVIVAALTAVWPTPKIHPCDGLLGYSAHPTEILVKTGNENQLMSKRETDEMTCLAQAAAKAIAKEDNIDFKLRFGNETDLDTDIPIVNIAASWAPTDTATMARAIARRFSTAKRPYVIPLVTGSAGPSSELLEKLEKFSRKDKAWKMDEPWTTDAKNHQKLRQALWEIKNAAGEFGEGQTTILILANPEELKLIVETASRHFPSLEKTFWVHPNLFSSFEGFFDDEDSREYKFAESVGLSTFLVYPTVKASDVELRKLKLTLEAESCKVTSIHRAYAYFEAMKSVFRNDGHFPQTWQVWNLFLTEQNRRKARVLQSSPWIIGEIFKANATSFEPISPEDQSLTTEIVRKHELLDVYAQVATKCGFPEMVVVKNLDQFSLDPIEFTAAPEDFPEALVLPANHGFAISLLCPDKTQRGAHITCGDDLRSPCVHSAFRKRSKRGLAEARKVLAKINARRVSYVMERPEDMEEEERAKTQFQRRSGFESFPVNGTEKIPVPYRMRQKAVIIYKTFHDEGLGKKQMFGILDDAVPHPVVRKEVEFLINKMPDTRAGVIADRDGAPKPKYPLPPYMKWLNGAAGPLAGCVGTSTAVLLCSMIAEASNNAAVTGGCHANGFQQIGGSCQFMMGRLFQVVFEDQSVICSALHQHGLLDDLPFAVDSAYGKRLASSDPFVLDGYHVMAAPLVKAMKASKSVSTVVNHLARPWIDQMMFESGFAVEGNVVGTWIMKIGMPLARAVGASKFLVGLAMAKMAEHGFGNMAGVTIGLVATIVATKMVRKSTA